MNRKEFLNNFLGALGAEEIIYSNEASNYVSGTVVYDKKNPEERQAFCWHVSEKQVPNTHVCSLVKTIRNNKLLSTDEIIVNRDELRSLYNKENNSNLSETEFTNILDQLLTIEVNMIDNGKETDIYFIHE